MKKPLTLDEIVETLDALPSEGRAVLDPETGEILVFGEGDLMWLDDDDDEGRGPDWMDAAEVAHLRASWDRFLHLPDSFEIHEWKIMDRFARTRSNEDARDELCSSLRGRGAFRFFRTTVDRLGLREEWFAFRRSALEEIARAWAAENGLTLVERS